MKKIGGVVYIHEFNVGELTKEQSQLLLACEHLLKAHDSGAWLNANIYKIDVKNNSVTFIESEDWDEAQEPTVGNAHKITLGSGDITWEHIDGTVWTGSYKLTKKKKNPQIYHHKWMFVSEDYTGFDVEESKAWSAKWQSVIPKGHSSRIGYKSYWENLLQEYGLR